MVGRYQEDAIGVVFNDDDDKQISKKFVSTKDGLDKFMDGTLCKVETGIFGDERDQPNPGSQSYRGAKRDPEENLL